MKRIISIILIATYLLSLPCFAQEQLQGMPSFIKSPDDIAKWFSKDFKYRITIPNIPQTPEETIRERAGSCGDFAALASEALKQLGISGNVIAIEFSGPNDGHAVCIWKDSDGTYSLISNQDIYHTGQKDMFEAVRMVFPEARKILIDFDRQSRGRYFRAA